MLILFSFSDPRVADWFLMQSPLPTIAIAIVYLLTVWLGPKIMAKREAFDLHYFMVFYNFSCVLLGAHIVKEVKLPHFYICGHVCRYLYIHDPSPVSLQHLQSPKGKNFKCPKFPLAFVRFLSLLILKNVCFSVQNLYEYTFCITLDFSLAFGIDAITR